jgi:D-glycerate 3-kinase
MVGINGAQGSGKSTLCTLLAEVLEKEFSLDTAVLSIDDIYLTKRQRQDLAQSVHPLLATRGVPGTHDIPLGLNLFEQLRRASASSRTPIPRFDKALDDRVPEYLWDEFIGRPDLILFEGWCVGAVAQDSALLDEAVNSLEASEDPHCLWRAYVNRCLTLEYPPLFEQLDLLLMLKIPHWEMVMHWRSRQEEQLALKRSGSGVMDKAALQRFVMHYERLTRFQLEEMPLRADLVFELNEAQCVQKILKKAASGLAGAAF